MPVVRVNFEAKGRTVQDVADQQWKIATQVAGGHVWSWGELGDIEPDEWVTDSFICDIATEQTLSWRRDVSMNVEYNL